MIVLAVLILAAAVLVVVFIWRKRINICGLFSKKKSEVDDGEDDNRPPIRKQSPPALWVPGFLEEVSFCFVTATNRALGESMVVSTVESDR